MPKPHISYVPLEDMDERMQEEMHRCAREGTPRPESSAVRAHAPNAFWAFADSWKSTFHSCSNLVDRTGPAERKGFNSRLESTAVLLQTEKWTDIASQLGRDSGLSLKLRRTAMDRCWIPCWRFTTAMAGCWQQVMTCLRPPRVCRRSVIMLFR